MDAFLKLKKSTDQSENASVSGANRKGKETERKRTPWVEKYRPRTMQDVIFQDEVVMVLKKTLDGADFPNLLFYGPPGTGKTSTILAAARDMFGVDMVKDRVLELNASDDRGISVIREKVKKFAQLSSFMSRRSDGKTCPSFKLIILDEADSMTAAAQTALRRTMETESKTTRFCLICNYVTRIIAPISSRCAKFRFKPLSDAVVRNRLNELCKVENVRVDDQAIGALIEISDGDLRRAITTLQSVSYLHAEKPVSALDVLEISGVLSDEIVNRFLGACSSASYDQVQNYAKLVISEGFAVHQLLLQLHDNVASSTTFTDKQKSAICARIAKNEKRLMDGADEEIQLLDLGTVIIQQVYA